MCSSATFKFLCYFYACCNIFCAISIAVGADKVSEKITRDNCSSGVKSLSLPQDPVDRFPGGVCNRKTYAALLLMLALACCMSVLLAVGVALEKPSLIKTFRVFLYVNVIFLFGCWLSIFISFYETHADTLMVLWGFVLVLSVVYFGLQIWVVTGACEAVQNRTFTEFKPTNLLFTYLLK
ncbi:hypothetical protein pipiens_006955 [Culex pipiens pipiens]|uniref:Uncharacterized protein n=1 Tax=Culex pipiens pipiens TaxID=38569 RepID=A0ABD1DMN2_CULPP